MNESLIFKMKCETARKVAYHQDLEIKALKLEIEKLKQQMQPTNAIGFQVKEGEKSLETAFKTVKYNLYD